MSASGNVVALFIGRFISGEVLQIHKAIMVTHLTRLKNMNLSGLGVGFASGVPSVLLSEIATDETRGTITTLHQVINTAVSYLVRNR